MFVRYDKGLFGTLLNKLFYYNVFDLPLLSFFTASGRLWGGWLGQKMTSWQIHEQPADEDTELQE